MGSTNRRLVQESRNLTLIPLFTLYGVRYEEIAAPYNHFVDKGFDVVLSSVKGGEIPIDPGSLAEGFKTADVERFLQDGAFVQ